jgi:hypothetical protein
MYTLSWDDQKVQATEGVTPSEFPVQRADFLSINRQDTRTQR